MKFQLKALAAAAILAASIPAQAAVDLGTTGNGSMILTLLDTTANVSAAFDLGLNYSDFNSILSAGALGAAASTPINWNLATNADYTTAWNLLFSSGATLANLKYTIAANDNSGAVAVGAQGYITTYSSQVANPTSTPLITASASFTNYVNNAANGTTLFSNMNTATNGASVANTGAAYAGTQIYLGGSKLNSSGNNVFGALGTSLGVQQIVTGASGIAASQQFIFPTTSTFTLLSNGQLSYAVAAVPEANTWAMMLLGLGFMGFVARRKQA